MQVQKAAGALGAYVNDIQLSEVIASPELMSRIKDLAIAEEVLFLPGQNVAAEVFQQFAGQFGEILPHGAYGTVQEAPQVQVLESTPENPSKIEVWHSDMTFSATPPSFTLLHGQVIPEFGGDTLWASATAAYEGLSETMRTMLDELVAVHDFRHGFRESLAEPGGPERLADTIAANPPIRHPLIRTHPVTGRKSVYVNALFTTHIDGLTPFESEQILSFLYQHIVTVEYTVRLQWAPHTIAIWDNRSTQHKPVNDFFPQHRRMHRVTIRGEAPA